MFSKALSAIQLSDRYSELLGRLGVLFSTVSLETTFLSQISHHFDRVKLLRFSLKYNLFTCVFCVRWTIYPIRGGSKSLGRRFNC